MRLRALDNNNRTSLAATRPHFALVNHQLSRVGGWVGQSSVVLQEKAKALHIGVGQPCTCRPGVVLCTPAATSARGLHRAWSPSASAPPAPEVQLRSLLALAVGLGRVAILPPLWCGMDRYWAPHPGKLRGAAMRLPFVCPADHVLELQML